MCTCNFYFHEYKKKKKKKKDIGDIACVSYNNDVFGIKNEESESKVYTLT